MSIPEYVRDHPITLTVGVNGVLLSFAEAFTRPTFAVFALLFTGAVLVRGRHTVTRMIFAAGVRLAHHARFHRFFSRARWDMDALWERLVALIAGTLLAPDERIRVVIDETAQRKTGGKIYGVGMVYDNRPKSQKGNHLEWGLTWVVATVLLRVRPWGGHVFAVPILVRLYRRKALCLAEGRPFQKKSLLALEMLQKLSGWLPGRRFLLMVDGNYNDGALMQAVGEHVDVVGRLRHDAGLIGWRPRWWKKHRQPETPPSFSEMLAALRREILGGALFQRSALKGNMQEILKTLIESIAHAA